MSNEHLARALRPLRMLIPLKVGTKFSTSVDPDADEGSGLVMVEIDQTFDFKVTLTIEDYGTLTKFIEALTEARDVELQRIKTISKQARGTRTRSQSAVREPTTPNPGVPERSPRRKRRRTRNAGPG